MSTTKQSKTRKGEDVKADTRATILGLGRRTSQAFKDFIVVLPVTPFEAEANLPYF